MYKKYVLLLLSLLNAPSFASCGMCDINFAVPPIFLQDNWVLAGQFAALSLTSNFNQSIKINTPYTIRCLISIKNFVSHKDQERLHIGVWDSVDISKITYIEGNNEETNSHVPEIILHSADGYVYFKHVVANSILAYVHFGPFTRDIAYSCIALEEHSSK